jgi:uncharacterized protein (TIGR02466 family)
MIKHEPFEIFKTPIWGFLLNSEQYHISNYLEYLLDQKNSIPSELKSNFGGYQSHDNLHKVGMFKGLVNTLENLSSEIFSQYSTKKLKIDAMWGNINSYRNSNFAHVHEGELSGVFYLQIPEESGNLVFINPAVRSDNHRIRASNYRVAPSKLSCIIFPSWLEHYVEVSNSHTDRISVSFNLKEEAQ